MTDIDTRIAEILDSIAGNGFMVMVARDDLDWLISQLREHREQRTMVRCNACGMGFRAREMGQVGGRRFCARCLADALGGSHVLVNAARDTCNRYREALEWYADHTIYEPAFANGGDDLESHGMKSLAGIDSGNRARAALAALNGDSND